METGVWRAFFDLSWAMGGCVARDVEGAFSCEGVGTESLDRFLRFRRGGFSFAIRSQISQDDVVLGARVVRVSSTLVGKFHAICGLQSPGAKGGRVQENKPSIVGRVFAKPKWLAAGLIAILLFVIVVQNMEPVTLVCLFWETGPFAKLWLIIGCMLVGVMIAETVRYLRRK